MDQNIVNKLLVHNQKYEKDFEFFPYKNDPVAVNQYEKEYYLNKLNDDIIPLLASETEDKEKIGNISDIFTINNKDKNIREDKLFSYLKFINEKYHATVLKSVYQYRKDQENAVKEMAKTIENKFMAGLLEYNNKKVEDQNNFISNFIEDNKDKFIKLSLVEPILFLKTIGQLRNPKIQYALLNNSKEIKENMKPFFSNLNKNSLDEIIKNNFTYPLDIDIELYYKKWIGKDKIHVKFSRTILESKYDYAKKALKLLTKGRLPSIEDFNTTLPEEPNKVITLKK